MGGVSVPFIILSSGRLVGEEVGGRRGRKGRETRFRIEKQRNHARFLLLDRKPSPRTLYNMSASTTTQEARSKATAETIDCWSPGRRKEERKQTRAQADLRLLPSFPSLASSVCHLPTSQHRSGSNCSHVVCAYDRRGSESRSSSGQSQSLPSSSTPLFPSRPSFASSRLILLVKSSREHIYLSSSLVCRVQAVVKELKAEAASTTTGKRI